MEGRKDGRKTSVVACEEWFMICGLRSAKEQERDRTPFFALLVTSHWQLDTVSNRRCNDA